MMQAERMIGGVALSAPAGAGAGQEGSAAV